MILISKINTYLLCWPQLSIKCRKWIAWSQKCSKTPLHSDQLFHLLIFVVLPFLIWTYVKFYSNNNKTWKLSFKISHMHAWPQKKFKAGKNEFQVSTHSVFLSLLSLWNTTRKHLCPEAHFCSLKQPIGELILGLIYNLWSSLS